jgi:hypothetical protein
MQKSSDYFVLALLSAFYLGIVWYYQGNTLLLLIASIVFAVSYILWGIFHHLHQGNFHGKIVLEYALVALLGVAIISTLLI